MEAPEKIYVHEASAPELTEKLPYHIEYIRKDAIATEKSPEWSEGDEDLFRWSLNNLIELRQRYGGDYGKVEKCIFWLKLLKERVQLRQRWSNEDEEMLEHCDGAIQAADYYTYEDKEDMCKWLKSLKDRVQPLRYVLNKEDEERLKRIIAFVWKNRKGDTSEIFQQEEDVKWLETFKNKLTGA